MFRLAGGRGQRVECVCVCVCACACACVCVCCGRVVVEVDGFKGGKVEVIGDAVPRNQTAHS